MNDVQYLKQPFSTSYTYYQKVALINLHVNLNSWANEFVTLIFHVFDIRL